VRREIMKRSGGSGMVLLSIILQEGFTDDLVTITIDGNEVFRKDLVKTRLALGVATSFSLDMPAGMVRVGIHLPRRNLTETIPVRLAEPVYLAVSVVDGSLKHWFSREPFRYM
jgi:hypothetical protein